MTSCLSDSNDNAYTTESFSVNDFPNIKANIVFVSDENSESQKINQVIIDSTLASFYLDKPVNNIQEALDSFVANYKSFKDDFPDSSGVWELIVETEVVFESETIISYSINTYTYTGGAHGNDKIILLNFDASTGTILNQENLFLDSNKLKSVAESFFIKSQKESSDTFKMEDYFFGQEFQLPENMSYSDDGFLMLYNVYEIASYAQGYTEFVIPYDELEGILRISPY